MRSSNALQIAFLLGAVLAAASAQSCNLTGVPTVTDFDITKFAPQSWYLQEIVVRNASEMEESKYLCYRQVTTHNAMGHWDVVDFWNDTTTGEEEFLLGIMELNEETPASWYVYWFQSFYSGVWTHTDYYNYAVQYYCPEALHYHPESMLLWTRSPKPDPVMLELLESIAELQGFPRENGIKIDNSGC